MVKQTNDSMSPIAVWEKPTAPTGATLAAATAINGYFTVDSTDTTLMMIIVNAISIMIAVW